MAIKVGDTALVRGGRRIGRLVEITHISEDGEVFGAYPTFPEPDEEITRQLQKEGVIVDDGIGLLHGPAEKFI